jgi:hypothetical protein
VLCIALSGADGYVTKYTSLEAKPVATMMVSQNLHKGVSTQSPPAIDKMDSSCRLLCLDTP